jgi:thioredoxin-like negative regulator of GroEL
MSADSTCALVDNQNDLTEIIRTRNRVIALFHASWCPYCVRFLPIFIKRAENEGQRFVSVQDDEETISDQYSITIFPTVLLFENGIVSKRLDGAPGRGLNEQQLAEFVNSCSM